MNKKFKIPNLMALMLLSTVMFVGCSTPPVQTPAKVGYESELPLLEEISEDTLKDKAILIVEKGADYPEIEDKLNDYREDYGIDIAKVEYDVPFKNFLDSETKVVNDLNYETLDLVDQHIYTLEVEKQDSFYMQVNSFLQEKSLDRKEEMIKEMAEAFDIYEDSLDDYLIQHELVAELMFTKTVEKQNLPQLVLFDDKEIRRVQGFPTNTAKLDWHLVSNGLLNMSTKNEVNPVIEAINNKEEFILIAESSTCPYCAETTPIVKEIADNDGIKTYVVNIASIGNMDAFYSFQKEHLTEDVTGTPTTVYFKEGKEVDRISGGATRIEILSFIDNNHF